MKPEKFGDEIILWNFPPPCSVALNFGSTSALSLSFDVELIVSICFDKSDYELLLKLPDLLSLHCHFSDSLAA